MTQENFLFFYEYITKRYTPKLSFSLSLGVNILVSFHFHVILMNKSLDTMICWMYTYVFVICFSYIFFVFWYQKVWGVLGKNIILFLFLIFSNVLSFI